MKENQIISEAEIKLGLNIVKGVWEVIDTDTPDMVKIKTDLTKIDAALKSGNADELLTCNGEMSKKYSNLFTSDFAKYSFSATTVQIMIEKSFAEKFYTLKHMGEVMEDSLTIKKAMQGLLKAAQIGVGYMIEKQIQKIK